MTFADGSVGFFAPGKFALGQTLERGQLENAIHGVAGVDWIAHILFRRHGLTDSYEEMPVRVIAASDEIFRVDGNPERPDAGTVRVDVLGGR